MWLNFSFVGCFYLFQLREKVLLKLSLIRDDVREWGERGEGSNTITDRPSFMIVDLNLDEKGLAKTKSYYKRSIPFHGVHRN